MNKFAFSYGAGGKILITRKRYFQKLVVNFFSPFTLHVHCKSFQCNWFRTINLILTMDVRLKVPDFKEVEQKQFD